MLVHEITTYELRRILGPIFRLEPLSNAISEIRDILRTESTSARRVLEEAGKLHLRYKEYQVHVSDLRWIKGCGPSIEIKFRRPAKAWHAWFGESEWLAKRVTRELVDDLKDIVTKEIEIPCFVMTQVMGHDMFGYDEVKWWSLYPSGAFNHSWRAGIDVSPIQISIETHSQKWFVSLGFNPGAFERKGEKSVLRSNWDKYSNDVSMAIEAAAKRRFGDGDGSGRMTYEEWCEEMIANFGDEVVPDLENTWDRINTKQSE